MSGSTDPGAAGDGELAKFPTELRRLIEAELAAGNAIVELGHSHPAPPAGAYVRLTRKVTTRARASGGGLHFSERNSSIYSGEFTDSDRFYFVIEPPNPPPPEPDMDAIRRAFEPKPDPLVRLAERQTGAERAAPLGSVIDTETPTSRRQELYFRDSRPPHPLRVALERELTVLFTGELTDGVLRFRAHATVVGARYDLELWFVAALPREHCYRLTVHVSWADQAETHHEYFRKTSARWIEMWTRELTPSPAPETVEGVPERYREIADASLRAEAHLDSVPAIQAAIIEGLQRGGRYATSHKEGGTNITWRVDHFVRSDYGDDPDTTMYRTEADFLQMLRLFCHHEATRHAGPEPLSEGHIWKLILRLMIMP